MLLADSGSTKCEWVLIGTNCDAKDGNISKVLGTQGINPSILGKEVVLDLIKKDVIPKIVGDAAVSHVYFYGAGCLGVGKSNMEEIFTELFPKAVISVQSDLVAAAKATCFDTKGIVAILGTGSNSCYYNGTEIEDNCPPLGYILGDEGSGNQLGRKVLTAYIRKQLPKELEEKFETKFGKISKEEAVQKVYKSHLIEGAEPPNVYLGRFATFLNENVENEWVKKTVKKTFKEFYENCLCVYQKYNIKSIHFVGSIALHFKPLLNEVLNEEGHECGIILQTTFERLIEYHIKTSKQD